MPSGPAAQKSRALLKPQHPQGPHSGTRRRRAEATTELFFTAWEARTALPPNSLVKGRRLYSRGSWCAAILDQTEVFIADKDPVSFTKNITIRFARFATGQAWLARAALGKVWIADLVKGALEVFEATVHTVEDGFAAFGADRFSVTEVARATAGAFIAALVVADWTFAGALKGAFVEDKVGVGFP